MKNTKPLSDVIAGQALALQECIGIVDDALNRCNEILRDLQPFRKSGQIGLLQTHRKSSGRIVINEIQWRIVRWQRQAESADGKTRWRAIAIPLKGAGHRVKTHHDFHDVANEVRGVVRTAVRLIRWRAQLTLTARNFVVAVEGHRKSGASSCQALMARGRGALSRAELKRDTFREMARQIDGAANVVTVAPHLTPAFDDSNTLGTAPEWTDLVKVDHNGVFVGWDFQHIPSKCWVRVEPAKPTDEKSSSAWTFSAWMEQRGGDGNTWEIMYPTEYISHQWRTAPRRFYHWPLDEAVREAKRWFLEEREEHLAKIGRRRR